MVRKTVAHADFLWRTAESAKGSVCELVGFGLPENDHVGMRQHSGVFVSGVIRSSLLHPSKSGAHFCTHTIAWPKELEETTSNQQVDLVTKGNSVFHIPFGTR